MNGSTKQKVTYATVGSSVICPHWCSILVVPEDDTLPSIKKFCALWIVFPEVGFVSVSLGVANVGCRGSKPARVLDRKSVAEVSKLAGQCGNRTHDSTKALRLTLAAPEVHQLHHLSQSTFADIWFLTGVLEGGQILTLQEKKMRHRASSHTWCHTSSNW